MSQSPLTWSRSSEEGIATTTAIAIGTDKNSQFAVKWAVDNLLKKNSIVILVHVKTQFLQYRAHGFEPEGNDFVHISICGLTLSVLTMRREVMDNLRTIILCIFMPKVMSAPDLLLLDPHQMEIKPDIVSFYFLSSQIVLFGFAEDDAPRGGNAPTGNEMQQLFLPYRGFCARKGVLAKEMVLHDIDISNALVDFIQNNSISTMILGASSRSSLTRAFRNVDVPTSLCKIAPNFCSVYVISKGKVQSIRSASQPSIPGGAVSSKRPSQTLFSADTPVSEDLCH